MATKKQTMTWDSAADQKLLLAVLGHYGEMKLDYDVIAGKMGEFCTPRAVQERIKKLKKQAHAEFDPTSPANSGNLRGSSSKTTLTPVKATRKRKSTAARGKALQDKVVEPATDDEDPEDVKSEDDLENPSKKLKFTIPDPPEKDPDTMEGLNEIKYYPPQTYGPPGFQPILSKVAPEPVLRKYRDRDAYDGPASELNSSKVTDAAQAGFDAV